MPEAAHLSLARLRLNLAAARQQLAAAREHHRELRAPTLRHHSLQRLLELHAYVRQLERELMKAESANG